jgi:hypothetical protein
MREMLDDRSEGLRIQDELVAVHAAMVRGATLLTTGMWRLAAGEAVHVANLRRLGHWLTVFVRRHHADEEELLWPAIRAREPSAVGELDWLAAQRAVLAGELVRIEFVLGELARADRHPGLDAVAVSIGLASIEGLPAAESTREMLVEHVAAQESVIRPLLASLPADEVRRLRASALRSAPSFGLDLLLGFLQDPAPATGRDLVLAHLPSRARDQQPELLRRYGALKASLLA